MKRTVILSLTLFAISLLAAVTGRAQQRLGIHAGVNFANVMIRQPEESATASPDLSTGMSPGFVVGGMLEVGLANHLALQIEPQYVRKGARIMTPISPTSELNSRLRLDYMEVPVLLKASMKVRKTTIYGIIGPSVAYNIGAAYDASIEDSTIVRDIRNSFNSTDLSLDIGAGFSFDISPNVAFVADCRYSLGLLNTLKDYESPDSDGYQKSSDMKVVMGLLFGL
jgi:hypothetical protein